MDRAARSIRATPLGFAALVAAAVIVAGCGGTVPAPTPGSSSAPTPTVAASSPPAAMTASPVAPPETPPSPSAPPASQTPGPTAAASASLSAAEDAATALATASDYLRALTAGRFADAWQLLSPESQGFAGSEEHFASERAAFYRTAGSRYQVSTPDRSEEALATWLASSFSGDAARAFVLRVDHPALGPNNSGWEMLITAPDGSGTWRIWVAR
jgi:hypothetical protein